MDIGGRTAVITGAASGIGAALATRLAASGADLVLADRDAAGLRPVEQRLGGRAFAVDVASPADNEQLAREVGAPFLLCLNAGVVSASPGPVWEASAEEWDRVLAVNLGGVVNGLRAFVPLMLATGAPHHILITASLAGLATWPGGGPYGASKHAVVTVAEQAALALADTPVSVTVLCPALVRSGMSEIGEEPDDVAARALEAVAAGTFCVVPVEWREAVRSRGERLADGQPPEVPAPS